MNEMNYISSYKAFAGQLENQYTTQVQKTVEIRSHKKVWALELAMHRMENELNGRQVEIIAQAERFTMIDIEQLETQLADVRRFAIKNLLRKNMEVMNNNRQTEKATVSR
jgi:hypothetical protein